MKGCGCCLLGSIIIIVILFIIIVAVLFWVLWNHLIFKYRLKYFKIIKDTKLNIKKYNTLVNELRNQNKMKHIFILYPSLNRINKYANATAVFFPFILLKNDWTFLHEEKKLFAAYFFLTIGHEMAHKDKEPTCVCNKRNDRYFVQHIREIRADFYGVKFATLCGYERKIVIDSKKKIELDFKGAKSFNKYSDHPTAQLRYKCLEEFSCFSPETIRYIAKEESYKNEEVIEQLCLSAFNNDFFKSNF